jgi:Phosphate-induced protein 1 conserved region
MADLLPLRNLSSLISSFCSPPNPSVAQWWKSIYLKPPKTMAQNIRAWPFHKPIYSRQIPPLVAPNADIGIDGMVINLASMIVGVVTNLLVMDITKAQRRSH